MDTFEKVGYLCLGFLALLYVIALFVGFIAAGPYGILGLIALVGVGALLIKVLRERMNSEEDDHYERNVEK